LDWFNTLTHAHQLKQNKRVLQDPQADTDYANFLKCIRKRILPAHYSETLRSAILPNAPLPPDLESAPFIVSRRSLALKINKLKSIQFAIKRKVALHVIAAHDMIDNKTITDPHIRLTIVEQHAYPNTASSRLLYVCVGMPIMLSLNLHVNSALTNGSLGTVHSIQATSPTTIGPHGCILHSSLPILIFKPNEPHLSLLQSSIMGLDPGLVPIGQESTTFRCPVPFQDIPFSVKRYQLPLLNAFA